MRATPSFPDLVHRARVALGYDLQTTAKGAGCSESYVSLIEADKRLPSEELENRFAKEATKAGLDGLKGHRSVGGLRASIYNAFPRDGVVALADFMREFERKNG